MDRPQTIPGQTRSLRGGEILIDTDSFATIWSLIGGPREADVLRRGRSISRPCLRTMMGKGKGPPIVKEENAKSVLAFANEEAKRKRVVLNATLADVDATARPVSEPQRKSPGVDKSLSSSASRSRIPEVVQYVGREIEVGDLVGRVLSPCPGAILVLGEPGLGKTTLTLAVASAPRVAERFGERRFLVSLGAVASGGELREVLLKSLGVDPPGRGVSEERALVGHLGQRAALVLLDDLETSWETCPDATEEVVRLLASIDGVAVLASMRGREAPPGVPWSLKSHLRPLPPRHSRALFLRIAERIAPTDPSLKRLLAALAGLPLAIELVATQAQPHTNLDAIWREWRRIGVALAKLRRTTPGRLSSLEWSLELSWQSARLTDIGRRLLQMLGRLPAGATPSQLDALTGGGAFAAVDEVTATALAYERDGRLTLLNPIRDFIVRFHPPAGADDSKWRDLYRSLAGKDAMAVGFGDELRRLTPEIPNIQAALRTDLGVGDLDDVLWAIDGFHKLAAASGTGATSVFALVAAECRSRGRLIDEARCLRLLGNVALRRSDPVTAGDAYERARVVFASNPGERMAEAHCIKGLADVEAAQHRPEQAIKGYRYAASIYSETEPVTARRGRATCHLRVGEILTSMSELVEARVELSTACSIFRKDVIGYGEGAALKALADLSLAAGELDEAEREYREARRVFDSVASSYGAAQCLEGTARVALARSIEQGARQAHDLERKSLNAARKGFSDAVAAYRRLRVTSAATQSLIGLAEVLARAGHPLATRACLQEALDQSIRTGDYRACDEIRLMMRHDDVSKDDGRGTP